MRLKTLTGMALLAALVSLAAWLAPAYAQSPTEVTIELNEFTIKPATLTATVGQPIKFTVKNVGKFPHNLTFELPSQKLEQTLFAQNLKAGETQTAEYTFTAAGDWEMYCPVDSHEDKGMKGTVTVMAAAGQPAGSAAAAPTAQAAASSAPAALPQTGGAQPGAALLLLAGLVVIGLGIGAWLRTAGTAR